MKTTHTHQIDPIELDKKLTLLEAIQSHAAHALISTTETGIITSFNPAAEKMLGYQADELVDKETPGVFHDLEEVIQRSKVFSEKLGIKITPGFQTFVCHCDLSLENQFEWTYVHKDGTKFPVFLSITALYDRHGNKTGYLGIAQDISEIRKVEDQLRRSNEELAQFAYRTSHDLKAPLVTIKGLAGLIEEDIEENNLTDIKKNAQDVVKHASRLEKLVVDILDLAKADLEEQTFSDINIHALVNDLKEAYTCPLQEMGVIFKNNIKNSLYIYSQETRLKQILGNLIFNAIKYSNPKKEDRFVEVQCHIADVIQLVVADNGIGIPLENQNQLFDMFTRFHSGSADGSGLGMSIVKKNIDLLQGSIAYSSSNAGTRFVITLPTPKEN